MPKYDLIIEEKSELKIQTISASRKAEAKRIAENSYSNIKGIVFSDGNHENPEQN